MKIKIGKLTIEVSISWDPTYKKQIIKLIREGRKLEAIKIYKDATGLGLLESKNYVESIWDQYYIKPKDILYVKE